MHVGSILTCYSLHSGKIDDACQYCDVSLGGRVFSCQCGGLGLEHVAYLALGKVTPPTAVVLLIVVLDTY